MGVFDVLVLVMVTVLVTEFRLDAEVEVVMMLGGMTEVRGWVDAGVEVMMVSWGVM